MSDGRAISRRSVLYITKLCNIRCKFCYYLDEENKKHTPFDSIERTFQWWKRDYQIDYVDITGGEPTIHPSIVEIIRCSNKYGIKPTVITNAQRSEIFEPMIEAGLEDLLISIHGIHDYYDQVVQKKGAFKNIEKTISLLQKNKFSFRTNTTLTSYSCEDIDEITDWLLMIKPRIANLIAFNPHEGTLWADKEGMSFQVSYSRMAEAAKKAINKLLPAGIWVNVRYMPLCFMKGYEQHVCNFLQWQFDPYEWEVASSERLSKDVIKQNKEESSANGVFGYSDEEKYRTGWMMKVCKANSFAQNCNQCMNRNICDGIYPQYLKTFGDQEFVPTSGEKVSDPLYHRMKDQRWALLKGRGGL